MQTFHVSFPGLGIHDLVIPRVAFELTLFGRSVPIYYYGILIMFAFLLGLILAYRQAEDYGLTGDDVLDVFLVTLPSSIIGARLYYVIFSWDMYRDNIGRVFDIRDGGMGFYGGVLAALLAIYLLSRKKKIKLSLFFDFFAPYLALGQGIGRWGNFFNQEAFGVATDLPWGMISDGTIAYLERIEYPYAHSPVHPTFLYEFIGNMIIFAVLMYRRKRSELDFEVTALYFLLYGLLRFMVEGLRTDSLYIGQTDLRISQLLSLIMVVSSLIYLIYGYRKQRKDHADPV